MTPPREAVLPGLFETPTTVDLTPAKSNPVKREIERRSANTERILARLQQGPATNVELIEIGGLNAVRSRIPELRERGYQIDATPVKGGLWRYELVTRVPARSDA